MLQISPDCGLDSLQRVVGIGLDRLKARKVFRSASPLQERNRYQPTLVDSMDLFGYHAAQLQPDSPSFVVFRKS
jgi:hypothetical protein